LPLQALRLRCLVLERSHPLFLERELPLQVADADAVGIALLAQVFDGRERAKQSAAQAPVAQTQVACRGDGTQFNGGHRHGGPSGAVTRTVADARLLLFIARRSAAPNGQRERGSARGLPHVVDHSPQLPLLSLQQAVEREGTGHTRSARQNCAR